MQSWATSSRLDHQHAENRVLCKDCHSAFPQTEEAIIVKCDKCHGDYKIVASLTRDLDVNPHESHFGEMRCGLCHMAHSESSCYCNECHDYDFEMP
ncbi:MAG: cytochrome c3 family protein [Deltaproteobacteria bacterium]|nr:cytochrome c3 family protein [Deltaproteobacteria bacterium]